MKSILKTALVGLLLVAGTTKPVASQAEVVEALKGLIPVNGVIVDTTLIANIGDLDISYPLWLSAQINRALAKGTGTTDCTIRNGVVSNGLGYVRTIAVDYVQNTATKLIVVTEGGKTICGIQFTIANNGAVTATYKTEGETTLLINKSYVHIEHGLNPRQVANKYVAWAVAAAAIGYGIYWYHGYSLNAATNLARTETMKSVEELLAKRGIKLIEEKVAELPQSLGGALYEAAQRVIGSIGTSAPEAAIPAVIPKA